MESESDRLILKGAKATSQLHDLGFAVGWLLAQQVEANPDENVPYELVWWAADRKTTIHYIEDPLVKFPYLLVRGPDVQKVLDEIRDAVEVYTQDEILNAYARAKSRAEKMIAVARVGVAAPKQFANDFFAIIERALQDADSEVRRTAVWATTYAAWPRFRPLLEQVKASDPDSSVREDARYVLAGFESQGIK